MSNGKAMIILLIVGLIKKTYYKMNYVPTYSEVEEEIVSVTLNLNDYVTQKEFKSLTKVDTSDFALKTNVPEIGKNFDSISVDKLDELEGKSYVDVDLKTNTTFTSNLSLPVSIYFIFQLLPNNLDTTITLASSLYGMISYTKNGKTNSNEYTYSGYGVSFS